MDERFLAALRRELLDRLGASDTQAALLQLGFVHGLRDACSALRFERAAGGRVPFAAARLPMRFARRPARTGQAGIEMLGVWPQAREARTAEPGTEAAESTCCVASAGYTSGWLSGLLGTDVLVIETECVARGAARCGFEARELEAWITSNDARAHGLLAQLPFAALRTAATPADVGGEPAATGAFDPDSPAVHVWGPVMVIPFSGIDETLKAIELIGRDAGAAQVSVVVLDLTGTLLDEGFGALALERAIEAVASWGAETILTGISPLSEPALTTLEQPHMVVRKDLQEAIATAFQIAEATRRPV